LNRRFEVKSSLFNKLYLFKQFYIQFSTTPTYFKLNDKNNYINNSDININNNKNNNNQDINNNNNMYNGDIYSVDNNSINNNYLNIKNDNTVNNVKNDKNVNLDLTVIENNIKEYGSYKNYIDHTFNLGHKEITQELLLKYYSDYINDDTFIKFLSLVTGEKVLYK